MNQKIRAFVDTYKNKPVPPMSVNDFMKSHNHEIWRKCEYCEESYDARVWGLECPKCGTVKKKKMNYEKLGGKTWVVKDGRNTLQSRITKSKKSVLKPVIESRVEEYRRFCQDVFENRKFISMKDFNKLIRLNIHANTTWYRRRMVSLKLIKIENRVIKPGIKLN